MELFGSRILCIVWNRLKQDLEMIDHSTFSIASEEPWGYGVEGGWSFNC